MGNLNCLSAMDGESVTDWIRRETKTDKKKRQIDDLVADVINQEKTDTLPIEKKKRKWKRNKKEDMKTDQNESNYTDKQLTIADLTCKDSVKESIGSKHDEDNHPKDKHHDSVQTYSHEKPPENELKIDDKPTSESFYRKHYQERSNKTLYEQSEDSFAQDAFSIKDNSVNEEEFMHETTEQHSQLTTHQINGEDSEREYSSLHRGSDLIVGLTPRPKALPCYTCQETVADDSPSETLTKSSSAANEEGENTSLQCGSCLSCCLIPRAKPLPFTCQEPVAEISTSNTLNVSEESEVEKLTQCYLKIMMKQGTTCKPQVKAIERVKQDPASFFHKIKDIPDEDKRGSINELKWSRHMHHMQFEKELQERNQRYQEMQKRKFLEEMISKQIPINVCAGSRYSGYVSKNNRSQNTCDKTDGKSSTQMKNLKETQRREIIHPVKTVRLEGRQALLI